jgi:uncharacterized membrane protein YfcA
MAIPPDIYRDGGLVALGAGVGLIAGMFGVGGGFLLTPLLAILFHLPLEIAIGTGLCQMIGVAVAAYLRHRRLGQGEVKLDWMMMAGSLIGVGLGAQTVTSLAAKGSLVIGGHTISWAKLVLSLSYIVLLSGIAVWMARDARRPSLPPGVPRPPGPLTRFRISPMTGLPRSEHTISAPLTGYIGLAMGFLSGLLGIGGGVALMPILLYGIGLRVHMAAGTGILLLLATSVLGTVAHARAGHVDLSMAMRLLIGSALGAQVGATLTTRMDGQRLRGYFVYLVLMTVFAVGWDLMRVLLTH